MMGINYRSYGVGPDQHTTWTHKFCWLPRRCALSNKRIWLKFAYHGTRVIIANETADFVYFWHDSVEHFIWKLRGN